MKCPLVEYGYNPDILGKSGVDMRTFRPRIDWWLPGFVATILTITTVMVFLDKEAQSSPIIMVLVIDILSVWIFLDTWCEMGESELVVTFGPLRFRYPFQEITLVRKGGVVGTGQLIQGAAAEGGLLHGQPHSRAAVRVVATGGDKPTRPSGVSELA
jgi:hypothetical protein